MGYPRLPCEEYALGLIDHSLLREPDRRYRGWVPNQCGSRFHRIVWILTHIVKAPCRSSTVVQCGIHDACTSVSRQTQNPITKPTPFPALIACRRIFGALPTSIFHKRTVFIHMHTSSAVNIAQSCRHRRLHLVSPGLVWDLRRAPGRPSSSAPTHTRQSQVLVGPRSKPESPLVAPLLSRNSPERYHTLASIQRSASFHRAYSRAHRPEARRPGFSRHSSARGLREPPGLSSVRPHAGHALIKLKTREPLAACVSPVPASFAPRDPVPSLRARFAVLNWRLVRSKIRCSLSLSLALPLPRYFLTLSSSLPTVVLRFARNSKQ